MDPKCKDEWDENWKVLNKCDRTMEVEKTGKYELVPSGDTY